MRVYREIRSQALGVIVTCFTHHTRSTPHSELRLRSRDTAGNVVHVRPYSELPSFNTSPSITTLALTQLGLPLSPSAIMYYVVVEFIVVKPILASEEHNCPSLLYDQYRQDQYNSTPLHNSKLESASSCFNTSKVTKE